jgi:predicted RNase H-like HicB family nuclease
MTRKFTAVIHKEEDMYVSLCPELDIASQGDTVQQARDNLREAVELFLEDADPREVEERLHDEQYVSSIDVYIG